MGVGEGKGAGKISGLPEGKGVEPAAEPHCGHQAVVALAAAAAVSRLCAAFISDRGAVQATLFVWGQPRASLCDRRRSARPAGRSQKKLNRAQYSGISPRETRKPVTQRWSSQRQRDRALPIRSRLACYLTVCAPGTRRPRAFLARMAAILRGGPPSAAKK